MAVRQFSHVLYDKLAALFCSESTITNQKFCSALESLKSDHFDVDTFEVELGLVSFINDTIFQAFDPLSLASYPSVKTGLRIIAQLALKYSVLGTRDATAIKMLSFSIEVQLGFLFGLPRISNIHLAKIASNGFRALSLCISSLCLMVDTCFPWVSVVSQEKGRHLLELIEYAIFHTSSYGGDATDSESELLVSSTLCIRDCIIRNGLRLVKTLVRHTNLFSNDALARCVLDLFLMKEYSSSLLKVFVDYSVYSTTQTASKSRYEGHLLVQSLVLENVLYILNVNKKYITKFNSGYSAMDKTISLSFISLGESLSMFTSHLFDFLLKVLEKYPESLKCLVLDIYTSCFPMFKPYLQKNPCIVIYLLHFIPEQLESNAAIFCNHLLGLLTHFPTELLAEQASEPLINLLNTIIVTPLSQHSISCIFKIFSILKLISTQLDGSQKAVVCQAVRNVCKYLNDCIIAENMVLTERQCLYLIEITALSLSFADLDHWPNEHVFNIVMFVQAKSFLFIDKNDILSSFFTLSVCIVKKIHDTDAACTDTERLTVFKQQFIYLFDELANARCRAEAVIQLLEVLALFIRQPSARPDEYFLLEYISAFNRNLGYLHSSSSIIKAGLKALELFTSSISAIIESSSLSAHQLGFLLDLTLNTISLFPSGKPYSVRAIGLLLSVLHPSDVVGVVEICLYHGLRVLQESLLYGCHKVRWNSAHAVQLFFSNGKLLDFVSKGNIANVLNKNCSDGSSLLSLIYSNLVNNVLQCTNFKVQLASCKALNLLLEHSISSGPVPEPGFFDPDLAKKTAALQLALSTSFTKEHRDLQEKLLHHVNQLVHHLNGGGGKTSGEH